LSHFVIKTVERFWPDGEGEGQSWVDLLTSLNYGDREAIKEKLLSGVIAAAVRSNGHQEPSGEPAYAASNLELLKRTIKAWGGPEFCIREEHPHDGDCIPAPIDDEHINGLDETAEKIQMELVRRMVKPKPGFTQPPSPPLPTVGAEETTADA
jgi:hypothetical protein